MLKIPNKYLYQNMSTVTETISAIKTFVFLDIESTGLPIYENNKTKITELCLSAIQAEHIRLGVFPRVQNKLNLCFNPGRLISADAERITGLSNCLLENTQVFSQETVSSINQFLNHNPQPVCLVAHNGFKFDYPLLKREIEKTHLALNDTVLCIDSLIAFREIDLEQQQKNENVETVAESVDKTQTSSEVNSGADTTDGVSSNIPFEFKADFDKLLFTAVETVSNEKKFFGVKSQIKNETTPRKQMIVSSNFPPNPKKQKTNEARKSLNFGVSYKLGDVFTRLTKKNPLNAHQADGDVQMLIMCAATLGDTFVDWCNENAKKFCDIPAMVPGRKIGT